MFDLSGISRVAYKYLDIAMQKINVAHFQYQQGATTSAEAIKYIACIAANCYAKPIDMLTPAPY